MQVRNTTLDDIAAVIGFTACVKLSMWFGSRKNNLYVPGEVREDHVIAKLIGVPAMTALVREWGYEHLSVPTSHGIAVEGRNAKIRDMLRLGYSISEIANHVGATERRVQQLQKEFGQIGLLPVNSVGKKGAGV